MLYFKCDQLGRLGEKPIAKRILHIQLQYIVRDGDKVWDYGTNFESKDVSKHLIGQDLLGKQVLSKLCCGSPILQDN